MTSTTNTLSAVQRLNKAYVQVPSSPLVSTRTRSSVSASHVPQPSSKLKENTPLRPHSLTMQQQPSSSALTSSKRKMSDRDASSQVLDEMIISPKKSRMSMDGSASAPIKFRRTEASGYPNNASEDFPNGFVYCHQCNKKRDAADTIRCTVIEQYQTAKSTTPKERACVNKYCKHCLKNRYEEDFEKVKLQASGKNGAICGFKCPKCRDLCNCPRCRKAKGLEPVGFIPRASKVKSSASSSKHLKSKELKLAKAKQKATATTSVKLRPLPKVNWTRLRISLDQEEADQRILIREFFLRFGDFLEPVVAKSHIEELDLIGGRKQNEDSWVSDMCIKALMISLLGALAKHQEPHFSKIIKNSVKDLRTSGMNLNKIWTVLSRMREEIAHTRHSSPGSNSGGASDIALTFPDPAATPAVTISARRSLRQTDTAAFSITHPSQMIPVLLSLIHSALETSSIRDEIDQGTKDVRDFGRDARDATKIENERWEKVRNAMEIAPKDKNKKQENREKRSAHKLQITNIENALKIIVPSFAPRFTPLGTDSDGCVYYALFPGMTERESALEYLDHAANGKAYKLKKKCLLPSVEERMEMREWSWFIAVWGKTPCPTHKTIGNNSPHSDSEEDSEEDDTDAEKWWGFWDPDEITRLAQYISIKAGIDDDDDSKSNESGASSSHKEKSLPPRLAQFKRLAIELTEYANLLRWRIREDKCTLVGKSRQ